jgi:hypothetical protein
VAQQVYADELAGFVKAGFAVSEDRGFAVKEEAKRWRRCGPRSKTHAGDARHERPLRHRRPHARAVEPLNIFWLEEPLHCTLQPADFVRLAAAMR